MAARKKSPKKHDYTDEEVEKVFLMMHEGYTLKDACAEHGKDYSAVHKHIIASENLQNHYARARELYLEHRIQSLNALVDSEQDVQRAKLKCDNLKWEASRVINRYREKQAVEHSGDLSLSLQVSFGDDE